MVLNLFRRFSRWMLVGATVFMLSACQTELYGNLTEREANEMLSALMAEGISATKTGIGDSIFSVTVEERDIQAALSVLDAQGLPRNQRNSIGEVFAGGGIVSSPFEERIRYIYALGEEVAGTLQQIDGVLVARVHIVMPEEPALGQEVKPSSAAVFIKQRQGYDLDFLIPQIRRLVSNSIEGVDYEGVTVVLVEAQRQISAVANDAPALTEPVPGIMLAATSVSLFWWIVGGGGALLLILFIGVIATIMSNRRLKTQLAHAQENALDADE